MSDNNKKNTKTNHKSTRIIDLHMHSVHSDGSYTTQELIDMLMRKGATIISFTDHDGVGCYNDLASGKAKLYSGVTLIPGIELTCKYNGGLRDMLGYGIDVKVVEAWINEKFSFEKRVEKQKWVAEQLKVVARKNNLIFDESVTATEGKKSEGFAVMQRELSRHEKNVNQMPFLANSVTFYWEHFINPKSDFYVDEASDSQTFEEAIHLIHDAGGKAFVAHPYCYRMSHEDTEKMIYDAVQYGVDGVELRHSSNLGDDVERIAQMAKKYNLLTSGGTDYHGALKPLIDLVTGIDGNINVEYEEIEPWINQVRKWENC